MLHLCQSHTYCPSVPSSLSLPCNLEDTVEDQHACRTIQQLVQCIQGTAALHSRPFTHVAWYSASNMQTQLVTAYSCHYRSTSPSGHVFLAAATASVLHASNMFTRRSARSTTTPAPTASLMIRSCSCSCPAYSWLAVLALSWAPSLPKHMGAESP